MYCTLQEAYNVPTFSKKKKNIMRPLINNDNTLTPSYEASSLIENFGNIQNEADEQNKITYNQITGDSKYFCKNYNICPIPLTDNYNVKEGFDNNHDQNTNANQTTHQNTNPNSISNGNCVSAPQIYEIPVSDPAKIEYQKIQGQWANQFSTSTALPTFNKDKVDMSRVNGYVDEEIEQYMQTKDMVSVEMPNIPAPMQQRISYDDNNTGVTNSLKNEQVGQIKQLNQENPPIEVELSKNNSHIYKSDSDKLNKWSAIIEIIYFVVVGLLFIILCDQLFRVALYSGMKETIKMLMDKNMLIMPA